MAPSPLCSVNGSATAGGFNASAGAALTIQLLDLSARSWSIVVAGVDDSQSMPGPALSVNNTTRTATCTAPGVGTATLFRSTVVDAQGVSYSTTFCVYVLAGSKRVIATGETTEGDSVHGHVAQTNAAIRATAAPVAVVTPTGVAATDDASVQAAVTASAGGALVAKLAPGAFEISAGKRVRSGTTLTASRGAVVTSTIATGDGHTDSVLYADNQEGGSATSLPELATLAAAAAEGATVVAVSTSSGIVGHRVFLYELGNHAQQYDVIGRGVIGTTDVTAAGLYGGGGTLNGLTLILNVDGGGLQTLTLSGVGNAASADTLQTAIGNKWPTLTALRVGGPDPIGGTKLVLCAASSVVVGAGTANAALGLSAPLAAIQVDRPICYAFSSGSTQVLDVPTPLDGVTIDLGGATWQGVGGRAWWIWGPRDFNITDAHVKSSFTAFGPDVDLGSLRARMERITSEYVANTSYNFAIEAGQYGCLTDCASLGRFSTAYLMGGQSHQITRCFSDGAYSIGLSLSALGTTDLMASRFAYVSGGAYNGSLSGHGVVVADNSYGNTLSGVTCEYNFSSGFKVYRGTLTSATTGPSSTRFVACTAHKNRDAGWYISDATTSPTDGTTLTGCLASSNGNHGFYVADTATNTLLQGCSAIGNGGNGLRVVAASGTVIQGFLSKGNNGFAVDMEGGAPDAIIDGVTSLGDVSGGVQIFTGNSALITNLTAKTTAAIAGTWYGAIVWATARIDGAKIDGTLGTGNHYGIRVWGGHGWVSNVIATGCTYGLQVENASDCHIGTGCDFSGCTNPLVIVRGATVTMTPPGGIGTIAMADANQVATWAQYYKSILKCTGAMTAARTLRLPAITGMVWPLINATTGGFGIVVQFVDGTGDIGTTVTVAAAATSSVVFDGANAAKF